MKKISLTQSKFALVDDEDFERTNQFKWCASWSPINKSFYAVCRKLNAKMTRFIMNCPEDMLIDHIDMNTLNNQKYNLRMCTHQENHYNSKSYKKGSSKYKGVFWITRDNVWIAQIRVVDTFNKSFNQHLGSFKDEKEAALAYDSAARTEHGEFGRYNFPLEGEQSTL